MIDYTYNESKKIRTSCSVEKIYSTNAGFISRIADVEYLQQNGTWESAGSRWLINETSVHMIIENGFKSATL
jgi:hypothetical protein